jgi:hypothetical protein
VTRVKSRSDKRQSHLKTLKTTTNAPLNPAQMSNRARKAGDKICGGLKSTKRQQDAGVSNSDFLWGDLHNSFELHKSTLQQNLLHEARKFVKPFFM